MSSKEASRLYVYRVQHRKISKYTLQASSKDKYAKAVETVIRARVQMLGSHENHKFPCGTLKPLNCKISVPSAPNHFTLNPD